MVKKALAEEDKTVRQWRAKAVPTAELTIDKIIASTVPLPQEVLDLRACLGMDINEFFPSTGNGGDIRTPRRTLTERHIVAFEACWGCPVRAQCLQFAMDSHENYGIWGGTAPKVRRKANQAGKTAAEVIKADDAWRAENGF